MKTKIVGLLGLAILTVASPCWAQYGLGYGGFGGFGAFYSSTLQEGAQRGFADVVRSAGMADLLTSEANVNYATAYNKELDNNLKYVQTYYAVGAMHQAYQAAVNGKPPTSEQAFRWAHRDAPKSLSSYEYDPLTGGISWPIVLQSPEYERYREFAEQFFRDRAQHPQNVNPNNYFQFQDTVEMWLADLKANIARYKPNDYLRAKSMIESLGAEAGKG